VPGDRVDADVRVAVVGHVEWVQVACVQRVPEAGAIVHADDHFELAGGGGAVAAVALRRLAGAAELFTALGDDRFGDCAAAQLESYGVQLHAARRRREQRRAFTLLDAAGERTITVLGPRLVPCGGDPLPWARLDSIDGVYFTGGDGAALREARRARTLVVTPRAHDALAGAPDVVADALVLSTRDADELSWAAGSRSAVDLTVLTDGARGGTYIAGDGRERHFEAAEPPDEVVDSYGCGDSFAAGLTLGLALGLDPPQAIAIAARCGAACLAGRGPYGRQLTAAELSLST
jgi:ribokinase